jgi:hypothetical protein
MEEEYHGIVQEGTKAVWIHQILGEIGLPSSNLDYNLL